VMTIWIVASAFTSNGSCLTIAQYGEQNRCAPRRVRRLRNFSKYPSYVNRALRRSRRNQSDRAMFVREINEKLHKNNKKRLSKNERNVKVDERASPFDFANDGHVGIINDL
jgi:hypothetical protein